MFASHSDHRGAASLAGKMIGYLNSRSNSPRAELLPRKHAIARRREIGRSDTSSAASPSSHSASTHARRRAGGGWHMVAEDELKAQAWLDERLTAFYHRGHGLWPRVCRFFAGGR